MKLWILAFVAAMILGVYSVPTFYEAGIQKRVIKTARAMTKDLIETRFLCLSQGTEYKVTFVAEGRSGYNIYNNGKLVKTVYLDQIGSDVVFSSLFNDGDLVFNPVRDPNAAIPDDHYSIFINDRTKESKKDMSSIIQIYINKNTYEVKLFRLYSIRDNSDLIFKEL